MPQSPEPQPGPSGLANRSTPQVIDSNPVVLPEHILPVPTPKNKKSNRGRKSSTATILTGSPYKKQLEESIKAITQRGRGRGRARGCSRRKATENSSRNPQNRQESSSSDSELSVSSGDTAMSGNATAHTQPTDQDDACCIFCSENYSNDQRGGTWIQCQSCDLWAHLECSGCETEYYICDFCK